MKSVGIIGLGLIGGSIGLALYRSKKFYVRGFDLNPRTREAAVRKRAVHFTVSTVDALFDCETIFVCVPQGYIIPVLEELKDCRSLVIETGSTKAPVAKWAKRGSRNVVSVHPLCGRARGGIENADAGIFEGSAALLISHPKASEARKIFSDLGSKVFVIKTAEEHDKLMAYTSHLAHVVAFAGRKIANDKSVSEILFPPSFRDMTRVSAGAPEIVAGFLSANRENVVSAIREMQKSLAQFEKALSNQDEMLQLLKKIQKK